VSLILQQDGKLMIGVTLEGTVIHRSGLITGGQGSSSSRNFDDNEVDRESAFYQIRPS